VRLAVENGAHQVAVEARGMNTEPVDVLVGQVADGTRGQLILPGRRASTADDDKPIAFGDPSADKRFELFEERDIDTRLRDD
jgi:hypothetical protein